LAERVLAERPNMRFVLMSGYTDEAEAEDANALPVLAKPFVRQDLARALQAAHQGKT